MNLFRTAKEIGDQKVGELFEILEKEEDAKSTRFKTACSECSNVNAVIHGRDRRVGFEGRTLLHNAVRLGKVSAVHYLISIGADVNAFDSSVSLVTPIMESISYNNLELACFLAKAGANLFLQDMRGENCLHYAARNGGSRMVLGIIRAAELDPEEIQKLAAAPNVRRKFPEDVALNSLTREVLIDLREKGSHSPPPRLRTKRQQKL